MNSFPVFAIEKTEFKNWLMTTKPEIVGYRGELEKCPIASYIQSLFKITKPAINVAPNGVDINGDRFNTPEWVEKFLTKVDNCTKEFITKDHALRMLREV